MYHEDHIPIVQKAPLPIETVCPMTPSDLRWCTIVLLAICWCSTSYHSWAQTSRPIPRTSAATEQRIREEVRYLQEETISIITLRDQLVVQPSVDSAVTRKKGIQDSGTADLPTHLRQEPDIRMATLSAPEFIVSTPGKPSKTERSTHASIP